MNQVPEQSLAALYAHAFWQAYAPQTTRDDMTHIDQLNSFLHSNRFFYVSLRIPRIPISLKETALSKLVSAFQCPPSIERLSKLLLKHNRIELLAAVLDAIHQQYNSIHHIEDFTVITSHALNPDECSIITDLIKSMSSSHIQATFVVDESLIVGIRIESSLCLWERSIKKELLDVSTYLTKKGIPC